MAKETVKEEYVEVPVSKIHADPAWNARSTWEAADGEYEQSNSLQDLTADIKANGQNTPGVLVPHSTKKGDYFLVAGFRRFSAVVALGIPTYKAFIRNLSPAKARRENLVENTQRADLRAADTNFAIMQYLREAGITSANMPSQEAMAQDFGLSQSYLSKHLKCLESVKPEILAAWREGLPLGRTEGVRQEVGLKKFMAVAQVDKDRQAEQWHLLLGINSQGEVVKATKDPVEKAKGEAKRVGALLGRLVRDEVITIDGDFKGDLSAFVESAADLKKPSEKEAVAGVLALSFASAKTGEEEKKEKSSEQPPASN